MVALTDAQLDALREIRAVWPDAEILLIGAHALGAHIDMSYRETDDIDLAIAVSMNAFPADLPSRAGWRQDPRMEHRFYSPEGQTVDLLPAGPELVASGALVWPSGYEMSLVGFDLAFADAELVTMDGVSFRLPSAASLTFLKLRAWLDRPSEREKDLRDIGRLLEGYIDEVDVRRWEGEVPQDVDFDEVSAYLLGKDLAAICADHHLPHVHEFLTKVPPARLATRATRTFGSYERTENALIAFRRGMES